jgi:hypothetical protein
MLTATLSLQLLPNGFAMTPICWPAIVLKVQELLLPGVACVQASAVLQQKVMQRAASTTAAMNNTQQRSRTDTAPAQVRWFTAGVRLVYIKCCGTWNSCTVKEHCHLVQHQQPVLENRVLQLKVQHEFALLATSKEHACWLVAGVRLALRVLEPKHAVPAAHYHLDCNSSQCWGAACYMPAVQPGCQFHLQRAHACSMHNRQL